MLSNTHKQHEMRRVRDVFRHSGKHCARTRSVLLVCAYLMIMASAHCTHSLRCMLASQDSQESWRIHTCTWGAKEIVSGRFHLTDDAPAIKCVKHSNVRADTMQSVPLCVRLLERTRVFARGVANGRDYLCVCVRAIICVRTHTSPTVNLITNAHGAERAHTLRGERPINPTKRQGRSARVRLCAAKCVRVHDLHLPGLCVRLVQVELRVQRTLCSAY